MRLSAPSTPRLDDEDAEVVRREHEQKIVELQGLPFVKARLIQDVTLPDGVARSIPHQLGRPVLWVRESCVRGGSGSGRIEEIRDGSVDRSLYVQLKATGYGASITVDLVVL
jgi:hypothetical protein